MKPDEKDFAERLEAATTLLDRTLRWIEERVATTTALTGDIDKITATVEATRRETELAEKLAAVERELAELKAGTAPYAGTHAANALRKTIPAATSEMLAKHGIGEGPVDVRALDAALTGLSLEQRIAVKAQLQRAGAIA